MPANQPSALRDCVSAQNDAHFYKEPGAFAHDFNYMGELLYDSIEAVGGSLTGLTRPTP